MLNHSGENLQFVRTTYDDGSRYEGTKLNTNGSIEGNGIYIWSDSSMDIGFFKNSKRHGPSIYYEPSFG